MWRISLQFPLYKIFGQSSAGILWELFHMWMYFWCVCGRGWAPCPSVLPSWSPAPASKCRYNSQSGLHDWAVIIFFLMVFDVISLFFILASPTVSPLKAGLLLPCISSVSVPLRKACSQYSPQNYLCGYFSGIIKFFLCGSLFLPGVSSCLILHGNLFSLKPSSLNRSGLIITQGN